MRDSHQYRYAERLKKAFEELECQLVNDEVSIGEARERLTALIGQSGERKGER